MIEYFTILGLAKPLSACTETKILVERLGRVQEGKRVKSRDEGNFTAIVHFTVTLAQIGGTG